MNEGHTHDPSSLLKRDCFPAQQVQAVEQYWHCKRLVEETGRLDPSPGDDDLVFSAARALACAARAIVEAWVPHWTSSGAPHNYKDKLTLFHIQSIPTGITSLNVQDFSLDAKGLERPDILHYYHVCETAASGARCVALCQALQTLRNRHVM